MKCLKRNKQPLYLYKYLGATAILDDNGNKTGEYRIVYANPIRVDINISPASGVSELQVFGSDVSYNYIAVTDGADNVFTESDVISRSNTIDSDGMFGYDYIIRRVAQSLNFVSLALFQVNGVIQVCIFAGYMSPDSKKTSIDDVVAHIDHCVRIAGIDHVGIGSDFDGGGGVLGCKGSNDMIRITVKLLEKGYSEDDLRKIWGANFFRVLNANRK